MNDILTRAESSVGEPIFALDIDPEDPRYPPILDPERIAPYTEAADRLIDPNFARQVHNRIGEKPIRPEWDEFDYGRGGTVLRFNEIEVDGTTVPVASKHTALGDLDAEIMFIDRWRKGDPSSFYAHSLLQADTGDGLRMLDYKRLGYRELVNLMEVTNMFTTRGRRYTLEALRSGASWLAITEQYGRIVDSFPKGFVIPGRADPKMLFYRTYDYGSMTDDHRESFAQAWLRDMEEGEYIATRNGVFCWLPLLRPGDSSTFASDLTITASGLESTLKRVLLDRHRSHADITRAMNRAISWYKEHPEYDYSTSATRRTANDAAEAISDHLEHDDHFRKHGKDVFMINATDKQMVSRLEPATLLLRVYTNYVTCGPIAGRLRCSIDYAHALISHIPKKLAEGIVKKYLS